MIISNEKVLGKSDSQITYNKFLELAFGDDGFDCDETLYINSNEIEVEVYQALKESGEDIKYFTLTNKSPSFIEEIVLDWSPKDNNVVNVNTPINSDINIMESIDSISNLLDASLENDTESRENKNAKAYVFGSSKGGTGKTFTSIICTYRYAKTHPHEKIALIDFDIIDGQVGITIHKLKPTMREYFAQYQNGYKDFNTMRNFAVKGNENFPQNVDFYLAPNNGTVIQDNTFWLNILQNCIENYDVVVIDTGIDYLNIMPISYAYKLADKIILVTTTSIKSVNSVTKQISKLTGETKNDTFSPEDDLSPRLNVVITQMMSDNKEMNKTIIETFSRKCNILAKFGVITSSISQAEYYGQWHVFDNNKVINKAFDNIMA